MPKNRIMVAGEKESFLIRVLVKKLKDTGYDAYFASWNINEINKSGGFGMILYPDDFEKFKDFIRALNGGISYEVAKEKFKWRT